MERTDAASVGVRKKGHALRVGAVVGRPGVEAWRQRVVVSPELGLMMTIGNGF
jgi:hypothetical protein